MQTDMHTSMSLTVSIHSPMLGELTWLTLDVPDQYHISVKRKRECLSLNMWSTLKKIGTDALRITTKMQLRALMVFFGGTTMWFGVLRNDHSGMMLGFITMALAFRL